MSDTTNTAGLGQPVPLRPIFTGLKLFEHGQGVYKPEITSEALEDLRSLMRPGGEAAIDAFEKVHPYYGLIAMTALLRLGQENETYRDAAKKLLTIPRFFYAIFMKPEGADIAPETEFDWMRGFLLELRGEPEHYIREFLNTDIVLQTIVDSMSFGKTVDFFKQEFGMDLYNLRGYPNIKSVLGRYAHPSEPQRDDIFAAVAAKLEGGVPDPVRYSEVDVPVGMAARLAAQQNDTARLAAEQEPTETGMAVPADKSPTQGQIIAAVARALQAGPDSLDIEPQPTAPILPDQRLPISGPEDDMVLPELSDPVERTPDEILDDLVDAILRRSNPHVAEPEFEFVSQRKEAQAKRAAAARQEHFTPS